MTPESSPFTPGQPVPIEFFVGRIGEVQQLRSMVQASRQGRFKIGFVTGERGIGKSSLASFVRHLCEREDSVAGAHVFLGGVTDLREMVRRTLDRLLKESIEKPWHEKLAALFGKHVRKVGLFGISVELQLTREDLTTIANDFVSSLRRIVAQLSGDRAALLLVLDDINGLASSEEFANWLKSTVDEIATGTEPLHVCTLIVGLEERRQTLVRHQPSLGRVFELVPIRPWSAQECRDFFRQAFESASAQVHPDALETMVRFAAGLPVLAHEIGDAVWRTARGPEIANSDAFEGVVRAAEVIGTKLLEPQVVQALQSPRYRSILRKLPDEPVTFSFRRAELLERLTTAEAKVLDKFLTRMRQLGMIVQDTEAGRGCYQFANQLHYLYFWLEAQKARHERTPSG